jgi:dihydroorotate dehydrogenase subfamily 2
MKTKPGIYVLLILTGLGLLDSAYLTYEKLANVIPPCSTSIFVDCGRVLHSSYSVMMGIPLSMYGIGFYLLELVLAVMLVRNRNRLTEMALIASSTFGLLASLYFVFLQLVIIKAICLYCMGSAFISLLVFCLGQYLFSKARKYLVIKVTGYLYQHGLKELFFLIDPAIVHERMTKTGEMLGMIKPMKAISRFLLVSDEKSLEQKLMGIEFGNPVGLSAGFDYQAQLTQILPDIGFGFQAIGTITNNPYQGNPPPMLGRLPKSKSLMVNKGFKNEGAGKIIDKLTGLNFDGVVGISIGRTNGREMNQEESVQDIVTCFKKFEASKVAHNYYELNISCPNLYGNVSFYPAAELEKLLSAVDKIKLKRPVLIKMPIERPNEEVKEMLKVIIRHKIAGVIFGNLQKNRKDPSLLPEEVAKFKVGYFSGKPTEKRSNELIEMTYKLYGKKLVIVGCGGIFSANDAYRKIKLGASLVQLITGMIFMGPQLIAEINIDLADLLAKDGYRNIKEAIGKDVIKK